MRPKDDKKNKGSYVFACLTEFQKGVKGYEIQVRTRGLNFAEVSVLLSCVKMIEQQLIEDLQNIRPDFVMKDTRPKREEDDL